MANALAGYFDPNMANANALSTSAKPLAPGDLSPDGQYIWDGYQWGWNSPDPNLNFDPTLGTNVDYGNGVVENFPQGQNPELFLSAGPNYSNTGGMKAAVPGTTLYNDLVADTKTRGQQAIVKMIAAGLGAAALGGSAWSTGGGLQTGNGLATASDAAYGVLPEAGGVGAGAGSVAGSLTAGADTLGTAAAAHPFLAGLNSLAGIGGSGSGGSMGITDWLNIGNSILGAASANKAANTQAGGYQDATNEIRRQFDINQANQAPYQAAGVGALKQLTDPNASFQASPDYAFKRSEGTRDIGNTWAARGGAFSGNALRALDQYNSNLASGEFGNWWNRQAGLAGVGQAANNQVGVIGQNAANNIAGNMIGAGDARASGIQNAAAILGQGANNYFGNLLYRRGQNPYGIPQYGQSPYQGYGG